MNCPGCQAVVPDDALFCNKCGQRLQDSTPTPAVAPADKLRRAPSPDEPETKLWNGGFSPKAMIGYWLLATALRRIDCAVSALPAT